MSDDLGILRALDDPELFGPDFGGQSWNRWRVFLAAMTGAPMDDAALEIFKHHTGRTVAPAEAFRRAELVVGRRGGKSRVLALMATCLATFRDYRPFLARGEVATVAIIAADRKQARSVFRYIVGNLTEIPRLKAMVAGDPSAESITLKNRVIIAITTASMRATRGYTFAAVLCDEIAFWRSDDTSANPDTEIIGAIRPGLSTIPGSMLLLASSPYRKAGVLYQNLRRHWGQDKAPMLIWRGTSREMNSDLDPAEEQEAYDEDPAKASAEWGAEFRDDLADFVPREVVEACVVKGRFEQAPAGLRYVAFVDPSGGSSDSMTLGIAHRSTEGFAVLDAIREKRPPFSTDAVVREFAELLKGYSVREVTGDRYAGEWPMQAFAKHGIRLKYSERPKSEIFLELLPMLTSGRVELLDQARFVAQLCGLERRTSRSGKDSVDHGPGGHDDVANAAAGALVLAGAGRTPMKISAEALEAARTLRPGMRRPVML